MNASSESGLCAILISRVAGKTVVSAAEEVVLKILVLSPIHTGRVLFDPLFLRAPSPFSYKPLRIGKESIPPTRHSAPVRVGARHLLPLQ